jgi:hypothetical protein
MNKHDFWVMLAIFFLVFVAPHLAELITVLINNRKNKTK